MNEITREIIDAAVKEVGGPLVDGRTKAAKQARLRGESDTVNGMPPPEKGVLGNGDGQNSPFLRAENLTSTGKGLEDDLANDLVGGAGTPQKTQDQATGGQARAESDKGYGFRQMAPGPGRPKGSKTKDCREQRFWFSVIQQALTKLRPRDRIEVSIKILDRMIGSDWSNIKTETSKQGLDISGELYVDLMRGMGKRADTGDTPEKKPRPAT